MNPTTHLTSIFKFFFTCASQLLLLLILYRRVYPLNMHQQSQGCDVEPVLDLGSSSCLPCSKCVDLAVICSKFVDL